jgi:hypothetical protein
MLPGGINNRKPKPYSGRNDTSHDSDFQKEQAELEGLKARTETLGEQRRVALFGSTAEKAALKQRVSEDANFQLVIKDQRMREQSEQERRANEAMEQHRVAMLEMEQERERQRRERTRQIQEENRLAALAKANENLHRKVTQDRRDQEATSESISSYQPNVF